MFEKLNEVIDRIVEAKDDAILYALDKAEEIQPKLEDKLNDIHYMKMVLFG